MFEKKKLWMALAATTLVAACGGGSGGGTPTTGGGGDGGNDPNNPPVSNDEVLTGTLSMPNDQLIFNQSLLPLSAYISDEEGGGIYGQAKGVNSAPMQAFGFRIAPSVTGENLTAEEATGRIAVSLQERDSTVDAGAGEVAEAMQFVITNVTFATDANNTLSVVPGDESRIYIYGKNAANETVNVNYAVPASANIVRVAPISEFAGGSDDTTTVGLVVDVDAAFAAADTEAQAALLGLADLSGRFDMNAKVTNAKITDAAGTELTSDPFTVVGSGQAEVSGGAGAAGNIWIDALPPGI